MRKRLRLSLVLIAVVGAPDVASACLCYNDSTSYRAALQRSAAVFSGTVLLIQDVRFPPTVNSPVEDTLRLVVFDADASWIGVKSHRVMVFTDLSDCGYPFIVGETYIVWANRDAWMPHQLITSVCTYTRPLRNATEQLQALDSPQTNLETPFARGRSTGTSERQQPKPARMPGWLTLEFVAAGLLCIGWLRWPSERRALSGRRRYLATAGLVGSSLATLGSGALVIYSQKVHGLAGDWSILAWGTVLFGLCLGSVALSWFSRGISRLVSIGSALILAASFGVASYVFFIF